jgi:DMSO/TMAO reductase YedYZ molybdopterin-dependent catalytic subunit
VTAKTPGPTRDDRRCSRRLPSEACRPSRASRGARRSLKDLGRAEGVLRRREFLAGGAIAVASALTPRLVRGDGSLLTHVSRPQNLGTPLEYFDRLVTPADVFFVRSHFGPPALDRGRRVRIEGSRALELSLDDLRAFPEVTLTAVLQCAGNGRALHRPRVPGVQWVHGAMGQATWTGVRLADVLGRAGIPENGAHVLLEGYDRPPLPTVPGFVRSIPLSRALDPRLQDERQAALAGARRAAPARRAALGR